VLFILRSIVKKSENNVYKQRTVTTGTIKLRNYSNFRSKGKSFNNCSYFFVGVRIIPCKQIICFHLQ